QTVKTKNQTIRDNLTQIQDLNQTIQDQTNQIQNLNQTVKTKNQTIQDQTNQIQNLNQTVKTKNQTIQDQTNQIRLINNRLTFQSKYGTVKTRIQNQLSYKLGQTMIINSKTLFGCLTMPIALLSVVIAHKLMQKNYKNKIKKDSSLILPPLEVYPDYEEAIKFKNHLSYRLGQIVLQSFKNPFLLVVLPYNVLNLICKLKKR
ncbi:TPA: coiled-coil domain-containing protein, partial [Campylobacter jejuni]